MKKHLLLTTLLTLCLSAGFAQKATSVTQAIHFTKLANTLRAVNKSDESVSLLKRAQPAFAGSLYWKAVTNELLGLSYNDLKEPDVALRYLDLARMQYAQLKYVASAWGVNEVIRDISGKNLYAGIQVGASGIKLAIFKTQYESDFYEKDIQTVINIPDVTLVADANNAPGKGRLAFQECLDSIRRYNIPDGRVFIVMNNDVQNPADKNRLYEQLVAISGTTFRIDTSNSAQREAELFTVGAIPRKVWPTTSALNIGSGSVIGGYFDERKQFHQVTYPVGVNTLTEQIDPKRSLSLDAYKREAQRVTSSLSVPALPAGIRERATVDVGGSVPWALVTFLHPDKALNTAVPISPADVARFKELVLNDYTALTRPDLSLIGNAEARQKASQDIGLVINQLTQKQLIAGIGLLESTMKAYTNAGPTKRFVFIRDADIGWVTGKFLETINYEYESTIAKGALYTR